MFFFFAKERCREALIKTLSLEPGTQHGGRGERRQGGCSDKDQEN
jgi:hypothetical protein